MHSYKMKISRSILETLDEFIKMLVKLETESHEEKLFVAVMAQIGAITDDKLGMFKPINKSYVLKLNIAQMYALVVLSTDYVPDVQTHLGNYLHMQSLHIQKQIA